jgi:hypothetical protein
MAAAGGDLVAAVDAVVAEDLSVLSVSALQQQYAAVAPQVQRLTGFGGAVLAELGRRGAGQVPTEQGRTRSLPGWAAEASGNSSGAAGRLLRVASALQAGLPGVAQAVLDGRLPFVRAEVLTRLVGRIDAGALAEAEPELLAVAQRMDPVQLAAYVRHQLATWVEPVLDDDERRAADRRYLTTRSQPDGSVWGSFLLPAGDAEGLLTALEPLARPQLSYVLPADWAARQVGEQTCPDCRRCPQHTPPSFADLIAAGVPGAGNQAAVGASTAARSPPGPGRRPAPGSRPRSATPASAGCCSTASARSPAWSR